ncbi:hypothetical protein ACHAXS_011238 [Conticribra weissflogii]
MNTPSTPPLLTPSELQRFEAPLIALANMSNGDLRKLFYAFFSFLHRRTDFYCVFPDDDGSGSGSANAAGRRNMGFKPGQAEQILLASFRQFPLRKVGSPPPSPSEAAVSKTTASKPLPSQKSPTDNIEKSDLKNDTIDVSKTDSSVEHDNHGEKKVSPDNESIPKPTSGDYANRNADANATNSQTTEEFIGKQSNDKNIAIRYTEDGKQIPVGNGGSTSRYVWTQTLDEVTVHIPLPHGIKGKDLDVTIGALSLAVKLKNDNHPRTLEPLEGTLFGKVRPSESTWTLETSSSTKKNHTNVADSNHTVSNDVTTLQIILDKTIKTWWATVLSGDPIIDTTLVDSTRKIDTYDEKTQAQIRRIMFDQRQERLGLPKSDEILGEAVALPPLPENVAGNSVEGIAEGMRKGLNVQEVGKGKVENLPEGVEFIDQETLDRASESENK